MYQVDEKPETIHLYVVREEPRPSVLPIVAFVLLLLCIIAVGTLLPYHQPLEHKTLRVPAIFLPPTFMSVSQTIIPTGVRTYPATHSNGIITIYNGSVAVQQLPAGLLFTGKDGVEIVTDTSVVVPAGNPPNYGIATVSAYAAISGENGNIPAYDIDHVYGSSIYIRNLTAFHGGKDSNTVILQTSNDRQTALSKARTRLKAQTIAGILLKSCDEVVSFQALVVKLVVNHTLQQSTLRVVWKCQFVKYDIPPYMKVTGVRVFGKNLLVTVIFVERPHRIWVK